MAKWVLPELTVSLKLQERRGGDASGDGGGNSCGVDSGDSDGYKASITFIGCAGRKFQNLSLCLLLQSTK